MKIGMGWVGWTAEQTLATDMQDIETAYRGAHERLSAVAGKQIAQAKVETIKPPVMMLTPKLFMAMFGKKK